MKRYFCFKGDNLTLSNKLVKALNTDTFLVNGGIEVLVVKDNRTYKQENEVIGELC